MSTGLRISVNEFDEMIARGEFDGDRRVELIQGELREMPAPGPKHATVVDRLNRWSFAVTDLSLVLVRIQQTIGLPEFDSVPLPDVVWVRERSYWNARPRAEDVLLVIEVADSSLAFDRTVKADLYSATGIADYWIVNVHGRTVEVCRDPGPDGYDTVTTHALGERISPLVFPAIELEVASLFEWPA